MHFSSKQKSLAAIIILLCAGIFVFRNHSAKIPDGFVRYQDRVGGFEFSYPDSFYLLADTTTVNAQEKPVVTDELQRRELNVHVVQYDTLFATQEEACSKSEKLNPGKKCTPPLPLTQEDLRGESSKISGAREGAEIASSLQFMAGTVVSLNGKNTLYSLYYSGQAGIYYARLTAFNDSNDLIWLEVPLWGVKSLDAAKKDARTLEFSSIIQTLRLSR